MAAFTAKDDLKGHLKRERGTSKCRGVDEDLVFAAAGPISAIARTGRRALVRRHAWAAPALACQPRARSACFSSAFEKRNVKAAVVRHYRRVADEG